jgi:hypothetical protein
MVSGFIPAMRVGDDADEHGLVSFQGDALRERGDLADRRIISLNLDA